MADDQELENFWDVVGSENYTSEKDEFIATISKCPKNVFSFNEKTSVLVMEEACPDLIIHYPELYTEIFCRKCGVCVEIKNVALAGDETNAATEEPDDLDEFLNIVGEDHSDESAYEYGEDGEDSETVCEEDFNDDQPTRWV